MKYILILTVQFLSLLGLAQQCCMMIGKGGFADFATSKNFAAAHLSPKKVVNPTFLGKPENFACPDGKPSTAYVVSKSKENEVILFVIHEWWGLNDNIKIEADKYFKSLAGVTVVAIDLYDGKVTDNRDSAAKYMSGANEERIRNIIRGAAYKYVGKGQKSFSIGWCFGGGWSLQTALFADSKSIGCVMYYGMPEKDINKLKKFNAPVLFHHAQKDQWINDKVVDQFEKDMKTAKKKLTVKRYDADHAFANPSNPKYNQKFGDEAFKTNIKFFKEIISNL